MKLRLGAEAFGTLSAIRTCFGEGLFVTCQHCGEQVCAYQMNMHAPACVAGIKVEDFGTGSFRNDDHLAASGNRHGGGGHGGSGHDGMA